MDENRLKFIVSFCFLNTVAKLTFNRRLGDQTLPYGNPRWDPKGLQYIFVGFFFPWKTRKRERTPAGHGRMR